MSTTDSAYRSVNRIVLYLLNHGYCSSYYRASRYTDVLDYYIATGRLSGADVKIIANWEADTIKHVAIALFANHSDTCDYQASMNAIRKYIA